MFSKIRKVLGVITDLLTLGRARGWWEEKQTPSRKKP